MLRYCFRFIQSWNFSIISMVGEEDIMGAHYRKLFWINVIVNLSLEWPKFGPNVGRLNSVHLHRFKRGLLLLRVDPDLSTLCMQYSICGILASSLCIGKVLLLNDSIVNETFVWGSYFIYSIKGPLWNFIRATCVILSVFGGKKGEQISFFTITSLSNLII